MSGKSKFEPRVVDPRPIQRWLRESCRVTARNPIAVGSCALVVVLVSKLVSALTDLVAPDLLPFLALPIAFSYFVMAVGVVRLAIVLVRRTGRRRLSNGAESFVSAFFSERRGLARGVIRSTFFVLIAGGVLILPAILVGSSDRTGEDTSGTMFLDSPALALDIAMMYLLGVDGPFETFLRIGNDEGDRHVITMAQRRAFLLNGWMRIGATSLSMIVPMVLLGLLVVPLQHAFELLADFPLFTAAYFVLPTIAYAVAYADVFEWDDFERSHVSEEQRVTADVGS